MTHDSPFFFFEVEMMLNVANFTNEGLVTPQEVQVEKYIQKMNLSQQGVEFQLDSLLKLETINIGHKSLSIIIGPYI